MRKQSITLYWDNGVIEKMNDTIIKRVKCILKIAKLFIAF